MARTSVLRGVCRSRKSGYHPWEPYRRLPSRKSRHGVVCRGRSCRLRKSCYPRWALREVALTQVTARSGLPTTVVPFTEVRAPTHLALTGVAVSELARLGNRQRPIERVLAGRRALNHLVLLHVLVVRRGVGV